MTRSKGTSRGGQTGQFPDGSWVKAYIGLSQIARDNPKQSQQGVMADIGLQQLYGQAVFELEAYGRGHNQHEVK